MGVLKWKFCSIKLLLIYFLFKFLYDRYFCIPVSKVKKGIKLKKIIAILLPFLLGQLHAQVNRFEILPAPDMPTTLIYSIPALDLSQVADNSLVTFELYLRDINFDLAGFEITVFFPEKLLTLSKDAADWQNLQGAVFIPADPFSQAWRLPHDAQGIPIAAYHHNLGIASFGLVLPRAEQRWRGAAGGHPGGLLGRLVFRKPAATDFCKTALESIQVLLAPDVNSSQTADYFSDGDGNRVALTQAIDQDALRRVYGVAAHIGYPGQRLWADSNLDDLVNALDMLPSIHCAILGQQSSRCTYYDFQSQQARPWAELPSALFYQIFNMDCSAEPIPVNALDVLRVLRQCLLMRAGYSRPTTMRRFDATASGDSLRIGFKGARGLAYLEIHAEGMALGEAKIANASDDASWQLIQQNTGNGLEILLFSENPNQVLPDLLISKSRDGNQWLYYSATSLGESETRALNLNLK